MEQPPDATMLAQISDLLDAYPFPMPALAAAGVGLTVLYTIYWSLLPKPIPGIPYNKESAKRLLGDLPDIIAAEKSGGRKKVYYADWARKHKAPVVQFFLGPGLKPAIIIADYREARDIVLRRSKETIRGPLNCDPWRGVIPGHFIAMEDDSPKFKGARALSRDLMSPSFLHSVRILDLVRRRT